MVKNIKSITLIILFRSIPSGQKKELCKQYGIGRKQTTEILQNIFYLYIIMKKVLQQ